MFKTLTIKNLMEMAKEVSDQMVLTKAEVKLNFPNNFNGFFFIIIFLLKS